MPVKPNTPVIVCLYCGSELKHKGGLYVCQECGERFKPDEIGMPEDAPSNPYRGEGFDREE